MHRDLPELARNEYMLVVGGDAVGATAAHGAAPRGFSTAPIEREHSGAGVSAYDFRVVHGGIRYIQHHAGVKRLRASSHERSVSQMHSPVRRPSLRFIISRQGAR